MEIPETKRFIPKGFELGTILSQPNWSTYARLASLGGTGGESVNSAGYSPTEQPIRAREKHYPLFQYILKTVNNNIDNNDNNNNNKNNNNNNNNNSNNN